QCRRRVRGRHPEVAPDQFGATAHRLGSRAQAAAHALYYGDGIPQRKVPGVLRSLTGLKVTQGALTQSAIRLGTCDDLAFATPPAQKDLPAEIHAGTSPRNTAAFRRANSSKVVGRTPNASCVSRYTIDSGRLRRSAKSSSSASARSGGTPAANRICLFFSGA